jgi:hypothetical protein
MDPPPLPFQLQNPERLRKEFATAGLSDINVETIIETTEFQTGKELWDWLEWSNPIVEMVLGSLNLTDDERGVIQQGAGADGPRARRWPWRRQADQHRRRNEVKVACCDRKDSRISIFLDSRAPSPASSEEFNRVVRTILKARDGCALIGGGDPRNLGTVFATQPARDLAQAGRYRCVPLLISFQSQPQCHHCWFCSRSQRRKPGPPMGCPSRSPSLDAGCHFIARLHSTHP